MRKRRKKDEKVKVKKVCACSVTTWADPNDDPLHSSRSRRDACCVAWRPLWFGLYRRGSR